MYIAIGPSNDSVFTVAAVSSTANPIPVVAAQGAGILIRVYKILLVSGGTTNITFQDGTTALSGALPMVINGSITLDNDGTPWFTTSANAAFQLGNSGTQQISGTVWYTTSKFLG